MNPTHTSPQRERGNVRRRGGFVLAMVLVVLVIVSMLAIGITQMLLARHRLQAAQQRQLQAVEMARAGTLRAAAQLTRSPDYQGETWKIPGAALHSENDAVVEIEAKAVENSPKLRRITARAAWGEEPHTTHYTYEKLIDIETPKASN